MQVELSPARRLAWPVVGIFIIISLLWKLPAEDAFGVLCWVVLIAHRPRFELRILFDAP